MSMCDIDKYSLVNAASLWIDSAEPLQLIVTAKAR